MRPLRTICLITLLLASMSLQFDRFAAAQSQAPQQTQAAGDQAQTAERKQPDYSQEAYIIERLVTSYRFEKDGTGSREQNIRVKIQSDAGVESFGQLVFPYSSANEKLDIEDVSVRKPDGSVVKAQPAAAQDLTAPISREAPVYTDLRQKHVTVPGLRPGDTLEYRIIWRIITPLAPNHFWLAHEFLKRNWIVLDERLEVNIPQDSVAQLKTEKGLDPTIREQDGRRIYSWKHANLEREKDEDKEDEKEQEGSDGPKPPQIQMTTFKSWDEVGQWYASLQRDRVAADDKLRAEVAKQTQGLSSDLEKVEALYNYVAKNYRYVSLSFGHGRYQPHAATEVFANQYGDCKDKHTLLASMLGVVGIQAFPALINSTREIDPDVPSPAQFNHVITAVPLGKETLWMDTTAEVAPFRLLSPSLRKKQALLIPESAPARLETTPADPPFPAKELVEIEGKVNDLGALSGRSHSILRGDGELYLRMTFRRTPKANWKQLGGYLSYYTGLGTEVTDVRPGDPSATEKPFEVEYDFTKEGFLDWSSKKAALSLPLPPISLPYADPDKREDSKPIELGSPTEITYRLKLSLPARYRIRLPVPVTLTRDYAEYRSSYRLEGNTLLAERSLRVLKREIPASRTQDYLAFRASATADGAQTVSVETDVAGAPSIPDSMKVEELLRTAGAAVENQNYAMAEELLKRALAKEPEHKFARRQLGYALYAQRKYDAAVEVLREQTKINPFDDFSYNMMGQIFLAQRKYEEAEAAFRKHIEILPLDKWARGNLGLTLVEWRRYKEAVPELEQAISLNPDREDSYQIGLGRAYANLGQPEKAAEAFDRAIKLSPEPTTWNNVAYYLALSDLHLDKAQQYSESAVTAIATELRNVELDRLTLEDLANVNGLCSYWDTLGWVHFKKGNLDLAEKYVMASWALGQHSEVGDHLGQISEKRGRKEEAIRWYALAAAGHHPVPEARENLIRLAGKDKVESLLDKAKAELAEFRTVKLGTLLKDEKEKLEAEFYIIAVPGAERLPQITGTRFIRGAEKLRPFAAALKSAKYQMFFPDETATKLIRRGTLTCQPNNGECSFVLLPPEKITSVD